MDTADHLQHYLQHSRDGVVGALEGLSEYDVRRPMTATGTNLLGVLKHLIGVEAGYLGRAVRRPAPVVLPWEDDGSVWAGADMWARADEPREYLLELYRTVWANSDQSIAEVALSAPAVVEWWPPERRETTFGHVLVRVLDDTARHAGHCDLVRELIAPDTARDPAYGDAAYWDAYVATIQTAADQHR